MNNSIKDKILASIDVVEIVGEHVSLTRKGREFVGLCPFHDDHRPSLSVSPQKQIFKCWSCGAGGDVIKFVQLSQRVDFKEALAILAKRAGIEPNNRPRDDQAAAMREQISRSLAWARTHFQRNLQQTPGGRQAAEYARGRGISDAMIERFALGFAADDWDDLLSHARRAGLDENVLGQAGLITTNENNKTYDRFRNRLIFPINDAMGRCVAFGGRTLGDDQAKYLNSPETALFSKSRVLYGLDLARKAITTSREAVVVEGYTDAVLLSQAGVQNVVATLGTALTDMHAKTLVRLADRIAMCFDGDEAGLRAADRAVETALRHRVEVVVVVMDDGQDPADFVMGRGVEAFKSILQSATGALEFRWCRTEEAFRSSGQRGQRDAVEAFLRFVAQVTLAGGLNDPIDHGQLVNRLAELLTISAGDVVALLVKNKAALSRESSGTIPEIAEMSIYDEAVRDIPPGMVSAAEELFGFALSSSEHFAVMEEALSAGAQQCDPWRRLDEILEELVEHRGQYTKADVIDHCNDAGLCELVDRAIRRIGASVVTAELCQAAAGRLLAELDLLRMKSLRGDLSGGDCGRGPCDKETFDALCEVARHRHDLLGAEPHWKASR